MLVGMVEDETSPRCCVGPHNTFWSIEGIIMGMYVSNNPITSVHGAPRVNKKRETKPVSLFLTPNTLH
jgi:hypothetical protein